MGAWTQNFNQIGFCFYLLMVYQVRTWENQLNQTCFQSLKKFSSVSQYSKKNLNASGSFSADFCFSLLLIRREVTYFIS